MGVVSSARASSQGNNAEKVFLVRREENVMNLMKRPFLAVRAGVHQKLDWLMTTALLASLSLATGCTRHVDVTKEMTWECAPEHYMPQYPEAQPVRFRFVEDPQFEEVVSGRGLCDHERFPRSKPASLGETL